MRAVRAVWAVFRGFVRRNVDLRCLDHSSGMSSDWPRVWSSLPEKTVSAYLGNSNKFDNAITDFAEMYADQNEHDHGALGNAVAKGKVQAETGV